MPPIDGLAAAQVVLRLKRGQDIPRAEIDRLSPQWLPLAQHLADSAPDQRENAAKRWLTGFGYDFPVECAVLRESLELAESEPLPEPPKQANAAPAAPWGLINSRQFKNAKYDREWLVEGVLVKGQFCVVGGTKKTLKSTLLTDLGLSLAAGHPFLGRFRVPTPRRVAFFSGESGEATLQETANRICRAKGLDLEQIDDRLFWAFELPKLCDEAQVALLTQVLTENRIDVVIIDPLYLCLIGAGAGVDPANIFSMGPHLMAIRDAVEASGATLIMAHHFKKGRADGPPELEDLSFAGVQEFARQWLLLSRQEPYQPGTGSHSLWFSYGGSAGHSGAWGLHVEEGVVDEGFRERRWEVHLNPIGAARQDARDHEAEQRQEQRRQRQFAEDARNVLEIIEALGQFGEQGGWATMKDLRAKTRLGQDKLEVLLAGLGQEGRVEEGEFQKRQGRGGGYQKACRGWKLAPQDGDQPPLFD